MLLEDLILTTVWWLQGYGHTVNEQRQCFIGLYLISKSQPMWKLNNNTPTGLKFKTCKHCLIRYY
jgi:hypothetical protein